MSSRMASSRFVILLFLMALFVGSRSFPDDGRLKTDKRPVSVPDAIRMMRLADQQYFLGGSPKSVAQFSPDGKRFVIVVKKGDLEPNTNDYSILLFHTQEAFGSPKPELLITMASSSNRDGVTNVKWLSDNETVTFIGEGPKEVPQVCSLNVRTRHLARLTRHLTPIVAYDINIATGDLVFEADRPPERIANPNRIPPNGITITTQGLAEILSNTESATTMGEELFIQHRNDVARPVPVEDLLLPPQVLSIAPNGRYVLFDAMVRTVPALWSGYRDDNYFQQLIIQNQKKSEIRSRIRQYFVLDIVTGELKALTNAPRSSDDGGFAWAPDGNSIVISGAYLPLDVADPGEREARAQGTYVVEIELARKTIVKIRNGDLPVSGWDSGTNTLILEPRVPSTNSLPALYKKGETGWKEIGGTPTSMLKRNPLTVTLEEDMSTPPKIFVSDRENRHKALLLDLNPQFDQLTFGKTEGITWKTTDGHDVSGGLYLPPGLKPGKRYPLVIQTHGFDPGRFYIDGPWSSAFAAQPLASRDLVVVQVGSLDNSDAIKHEETDLEGADRLAAYQGLVDNLDSKGLIDRNRVGIIGFSRTAYHVAYTLTHSRYRFAAAVLADGIDGGYFQYIALPTMAPDSFLLNGGRPVGTNLLCWLKNSPGFNLDKVNTPVRLEAFGAESVLEEWEWFSGLSALGKPVELIYLPDAPHLIVKPSERVVAQQGLVDWFVFWLKGEEDPDPAKTEQYSRWRELRQLQGENTETNSK